MSLEQTISEAIKTAMREKDRVALDSLRAVKAQILLLQTEVCLMIPWVNLPR